MNKEIIENIWNKIIPTGEGEFEYKLLSKKSIPQLNNPYRFNLSFASILFFSIY